MDVSGVGIGAVLEQGGHVTVYTSQPLTASEWQYSAVQRDCWAVVYALKQFRHYLWPSKHKPTIHRKM